MTPSRFALILCAVLLPLQAAIAQLDARMLRHPTVSNTHVAFVYAGDIWVAPRAGGTAHRLSTPAGEDMLPRFSPDGSRIAFSANYDGSTAVYVMPAMGGAPTRLTWHGGEDRTIGWTPDGSRVMFASTRESGRENFWQLYTIPAEGGPAEKLPVPYGEFGAISPDGKTLAYMPGSRDFRTWKRYRGGRAPDIWLFDLETFESRNLTDASTNDGHPMWHGSTLYFLSDRDANMRHNIWAYSLDDGSFRQVTRFTDFDVRFPSNGASNVVFEAGGRLYLLDLNSEEYREVRIDVVTDKATLRPRTVNVERLIQNADISPDGKRVLFEARGDVFSVPAEHGPVFNVTRSSGVAERYPAWSPDGRHIAYWSDESGEYELYRRGTGSTSAAERLTNMGPGFRYKPHWSPESRRIAFVDQDRKIYVLDVQSRSLQQIDQELWQNHGALQNFHFDWSSDGRWLTYARGTENRGGAIFLYDTQTGQRHQVTSAYYNDRGPVFDPDGKYLYFQSVRHFQPVYSSIDNSFVYPNATRIFAVPLRRDSASPLAPRNDEVKADGENGNNNNNNESSGNEAVEIDLEGFESRAVELPPDAGNYGRLAAISGKLIFHRQPRSGSGANERPLLFYDLDKREEKTIIGDVDGFAVSADGKQILVVKDRRFSIIKPDENQRMEKTLRTSEMEAEVDPRAEWRQMFHEAWRLNRDYFYDRDMHGVDWAAVRVQYAPLLDDAVTRYDLHFLIGEMIGELDASHTYRSGGDFEDTPNRRVGYLGIDWELHDGAYRVGRIVRAAPWDTEVRSALDQPGVDISEGDYILAVNGIRIDTDKEPFAAFQGLAGRTVSLTVNDRPAMDGARTVLVETLGSEARLRHLEWIEQNRRRVDEATDGRVGYIYVRSTGIDGQNELVRQFQAQFMKDGLIIDERFNSGGQIPDRFIELLNRQALAFWAVREGKTWQWPPVAHFGPKVMLINGWSGSGGDAFPDYFRKSGLGPLIGTRTWGGLIGITGAPTLVDGGTVSVPTFRMFDPEGTWFAEGHGVEPDINVPADPTQMARGVDPQLERAISEVMRKLEDRPFVLPEVPPYEIRVAPAVE